jgi:nitrogen fixation NifU-like protein
VSAYPEKIRRHFSEPHNVGAIEVPSGRGRAENLGCGDVLQIDVDVDAGVVVGIAFQARACSAVIALASIATDAAKGLSVEHVRALDVEAMAKDAGGLPRSKAHAPKVVERALNAALDALARD